MESVISLFLEDVALEPCVLSLCLLESGFTRIGNFKRYWTRDFEPSL